jgi:hypothetical protein
METAPVILFTYNRLKHTRATVHALQQNKEAENSKLIIFSDAAANETQITKVDEVRNFIKTITGFKSVEIIEREKNYGLGQNIIEGVTQVVNQYGKVIVLEDDLVTSPFFLKYINDALNLYVNEEKVVSVHGYVYPVKQELPETFFLRGADCLGWGTWKRGWDNFEKDGEVLLNILIQKNLTEQFDFFNNYPYTQMLRDQIAGKNSSWAVRWYASAFIKDLYTLYPGRSLVFHSGGDGSGTNTGYDDFLNVRLSRQPVKVLPGMVQQNVVAYLAYANFHRKISNPSLLYRIKRVLKKARQVGFKTTS